MRYRRSSRKFVQPAWVLSQLTQRKPCDFVLTHPTFCARCGCSSIPDGCTHFSWKFASFVKMGTLKTVLCYRRKRHYVQARRMKPYGIESKERLAKALGLRHRLQHQSQCCSFCCWKYSYNSETQTATDRSYMPKGNRNRTKDIAWRFKHDAQGMFNKRGCVPLALIKHLIVQEGTWCGDRMQPAAQITPACSRHDTLCRYVNVQSPWHFVPIS